MLIIENKADYWVLFEYSPTILLQS